MDARGRPGGSPAPGDGGASAIRFLDDILDGWGFLVADFTREYRADLNHALVSGVGWRWFALHVQGLSAQAVWPYWRHNKPRPLLEGAAAESYFETIGR